jgi:hypothetical protein
VGIASLRHLFGLPIPDKACSFSPPNSVVAYEDFAMDVDVIALSMDDLVVG